MGSFYCLLPLLSHHRNFFCNHSQHKLSSKVSLGHGILSQQQKEGKTETGTREWGHCCEESDQVHFWRTLEDLWRLHWKCKQSFQAALVESWTAALRVKRLGEVLINKFQREEKSCLSNYATCHLLIFWQSLAMTVSMKPPIQFQRAPEDRRHLARLKLLWKWSVWDIKSES